MLWLLEELGLPYEVRRYERDPATMLAPAELRAVHPLGKAPVLTDGEKVVAETAAIVEYLLDRAGGQRLRPAPGTPEFLRYHYWLHLAEGSAMPPLLLKLVFDRVASAPMPFFVRPVARGIAQRVLASFVMPNIVAQLNFMEAELGRDVWFAGPDITAADVMMSFPLEATAQRGGLDASRPRLLSPVLFHQVFPTQFCDPGRATSRIGPPGDAMWDGGVMRIGNEDGPGMPGRLAW